MHKIARLNLELPRPRNAKFNSLSLALVGNVFQNENDEPIGYVPCRLAKDVPPERKVRSGAGEVLQESVSPPEGQSDPIAFGNLGPYESMIVSAMTWGRFSTYVLTGEMGSGKTATISQVVAALRRIHKEKCGKCERSEPVLIHTDFNKNFRQRKLDDLLSKFRKQLYTAFRAHVRTIFMKHDLADKFWTGMSSDVRVLFDRLSDRVPHEEWKTLSNLQRTRLILDYVDEETNKGEQPFDAMLELVRFVRLEVLPDNPCFVLVFDNVDSILPEFQYEILLEILAMQKTCQLKALVAMRWATFERLNDQGAYTFGVIPHVGPGAKEIIHRRIDYYIKNLPGGAPGAPDDPHHPVWRRLHYLHRTRDDEFGALKRVGPIAGASVRQALALMNRALRNDVIKFDIDPLNRNDMVRAFFTTPDRDELTIRDSSVANIFVNSTNEKADLINVHILQLCAAVSVDSPLRKVNTLYALLKVLGPWGPDEIRQAFNYLLLERRPLLWVDGKTKYDTSLELHNCDDVVHVTESGMYYSQKLITDVTYLQETLLSAFWPDDAPKAVDYSDITQRFDVLKYCIGKIMEYDVEATKRFLKWLSIRDLEDVTVRLISNDMLHGAGRATLGILKSGTEITGKQSDQVRRREALKDWRELVIKGMKNADQLNESFKELHGNRQLQVKKLEKLDAQYDKALRKKPSLNISPEKHHV